MKYAIAVIALTMPFLPALALFPPRFTAPPTTDYFKVEVRGTFRVRTGREIYYELEYTRPELLAPRAVYPLTFAKDEQFLDQANRANGKKVIVTGHLTYQVGKGGGREAIAVQGIRFAD